MPEHSASIPALPDVPPPWLRQLVWIGATLGTLSIIVMLVLGLIHVNALSTTVANNANANTKALCALRADVQTRVTGTENFIKHHPHGIPGISKATLQTSIVNGQHTIKALSPINCHIH